ncbi:MAG: hypothetical protein Kow0056_08630 [Coriobacteriia bacterium]
MREQCVVSEAENNGKEPRAEDYSHLPKAGQALVSRFRSRFVQHVVLANPKSILEVGCGQGWLTAQIAQALPSARVVGLDIRPQAIEYARSLCATAEFLVGDGAALPFNDSEFDLVVCSEVLEHVEDPQSVLDEMDRVGRGHAILSVPHEPWFWLTNLVRLRYLRTLGNCPGHIHHWTASSFRRMLSERYSRVQVENASFWLIAEVYQSAKGPDRQPQARV